MPFRPGLMTVDPANPPAWALYGLCTLNRLCYYQLDALALDWARWAGATSYVLIPESATILSTAAVMFDEAGNTIIAFEGTRNIAQLVGEIVGSAQTEQIPNRGKAGNFWQWILAQRLPAINRAIASLPSRAPICVVGHSLGGAIGQLQAKAWDYANAYTITSLVTFGQPRTGDFEFENTTFVPRVRVVNTGDPVPYIPPNAPATNAIISVGSLGYVTYEYIFLGDQFRIAPPNLVKEGLQPTTGESVGAIASELLQGNTPAAPPFEPHLLSQYCSGLGLIALRQGAVIPLGPLSGLNQAMDTFDSINVNAPFPPISPPSPGILADPNTRISPAPGPPITPVQDLGLGVESRNQVLELLPRPMVGGVLAEVAMPYTHAKVTWWFQCNGLGWTESLLVVANGQTPQSNYGAAFSMLQAILGMCGSNTTAGYLRISMKTLPQNYPLVRPTRSSQLYAFPFLAGSAPPGPGGGKPYTDKPQVAIILTMTPVTAGFAPKLMYIRGIPDDFDVQGGQPGAPTLIGYFGANWTALILTLTSGSWGWQGKNPTLSPFDLPLTNIVQSVPPGNPIVTCAGNPWFGLNGVVPTRLASITTPGNLNGVHPLRVLTGTTAQFKQPTAMLPWDGFTGTVSVDIPDFTAILDVDFDRLGERKCGAVFPRIRGRARARKLG